MIPRAFSIETGAYFAGVILLLGGFFWSLPRLTRRDIFFAVTVAPGFRDTEEAKRIVRQSRSAIWIHTLIALGLVGVGFAARSMPLLLAAVVWQCGTAYWALGRGRERALPFATQPSTLREAHLARPRAGGLGFGLLQLGPFAILAAVALGLRVEWRQIPARFPIAWAPNGVVEGWAIRSWLGVFEPLLIGWLACMLAAIIAIAIRNGSRRIHAGGEAGQAEDRFRRTQCGILVGVEYLLALLFSWEAMIPLAARAPSPPIGRWEIPPLILGFVVAVFVIAIRCGQGGTGRLPASAMATPSVPAGDRTPDRCWKSGWFYLNRDDPAVLVEKRIGFGYTLNFGNPRGWLLLVAMGAIPALIAWLSVHTH